MPSLGSLLLAAEDKKGDALSEREVEHVRDNAIAIMMRREHAATFYQERGVDIDPENCWYDFQMLRRELGRKPDLDPGARMMNFRNDDSDMAAAMDNARATLDEFRRLYTAHGHAAFPLVKTLIEAGDSRAHMWLMVCDVRKDGFVAEFFEVPGNLAIAVGDRLELADAEVEDWMINLDGQLHGGYTLRYQRAQLPEHERAAFDAHIGVERYC